MPMNDDSFQWRLTPWASLLGEFRRSWSPQVNTVALTALPGVMLWLSRCILALNESRFYLGMKPRRVRLYTPKPRRNQDALYETTGPIAHGEGLRSASRGNPNPYRCPQPLYRSWHTYHLARRLNPSGVRGGTSLIQQSPSE